MGAEISISGRARRKQTLAWLLLTPSLILMFFTLVLPMVFQAVVSFTKHNMMFPWEKGFAGLSNYVAVFRDPSFWNALRITLVFVVGSVSLEIILGTGVAVALNQEFRGRGVARAFILIPWALPPVVVGLTWSWILSGSFGVLNGLLYELGLIHEYIPWLSYPRFALFLVVLVEVWKSMPFVAILMLAGLQSIPLEVLESATVDGATSLQRFFRITLPLVRPMLVVGLTLETIWAFKAFDLIYLLTKGGPANATEVLGYLIYSEAFGKLNFGTSAAMSFILVAIISILVAVMLTSRSIREAFILPGAR